MKIQIPASTLLGVISAVQKGVASSSTKPILSNVKLVVADGLLTATATDLECIVQRTVPLEGSFAAVVDPKRLTAILKELGDDEVSLKLDDDTVVVKSSAGKWNLPSMPPDEFPDFSGSSTGEVVELTVVAGLFRQACKRTMFAAEKRENTRYAVTGVLLEVEQSLLKLVATDTKRLAVSGAPCSTGEIEKPKSGFLVPIKALQLVLGSIQSNDETLTVKLTANGAEFSTANSTVYTRLVEGRFPPYLQFLPKKFETKVNLKLQEFAAKVRQASITADAETKRVDFAFGPGVIEMKASGAESGSSEVDHPLGEGDYEGKEVTISFDPLFLATYFNSVSDEEYGTLQITEAADRAVFRTGDSLYLVVPMVA